MLQAFLPLLFLPSCVEPPAKQTETTPKAQVSITGVARGYLPDYIKLTGKTIYLNKTRITAPINGYVTQVKIRQGDKVKKGNLLFEMKTPEAYVMENPTRASENYGIVKIPAPVDGRVVNLNIVSSNVFSNKGNEMCVLLASNDLTLQVSVPFEYSKFTRVGTACKVVLPDGKEIEGTFSKILPRVDEKSQTLKVLANLDSDRFIPENIITKVLVNRGIRHETQIVPKSCLQTDALMTEFWVMKLINDSTAVQVPVTVGNQTHDQVEIISPVFSHDVRIINQGAYGLSDTVLVKVEKDKIEKKQICHQ